MSREFALKLNGVGIEYLQRQSFFRHKKHRVLSNITFNITKGETLGVLGRNGCGKSTLLKVLAGIIAPDQGNIEFFGNSVSLLTLAAGFDNELSGRDNAIVSAMLLGNTKADAIAQLDEVNEFAELGGAFEEPVKTYSAGMRARLGFSIAVKMQADVLLIDEVLGVGDEGFKKKARSVILDRINSEQTVVLVSHSVDTMVNLCQRAIWLERGQLKGIGEAATLCEEYRNTFKL
ncbi:ABC transporter ATP-binding protein [Aestuariibacter salexigens]|uniref:ABC transporter ATP-binding protein n=1 Tax=Aestuariibacter salexigens TaxID=226010 RepID=UPI0004257CB2|nr:ABC transporter ATP-binding protein [Aestuariibacter salexigens]